MNFKRKMSLLLAAILMFTPVMQVQATPDVTVEVSATPDGITDESPASSVSPEASVTPGENPAVTPDPSASPEESSIPEKQSTPTESSVPEAEQPTPEESPTPAESPDPDASTSPKTSPGATPQEEHPEFVNSYIDLGITVGMPDRPAPMDDWCYASSLPVSYDGREAGQVSSVKNQNPFGTCWAFSAVALAESAYMKLYGEETDLSESHLVEFFYNGEDEDLVTDTGNITGDYVLAKSSTQEQQGGNSIYTTFALAGWKGIADESLDTSLQYTTAVLNNAIEIPVQYAFSDTVHLENAYFIPTLDREGMKKAIMEYGGISVSYCYSSSYDSSWYNGEAYFCPVDQSTNHAVTIVGWDDNYSVDQFKTTTAYMNGTDTALPASDGAWLVKNSWGTNYHDGGYFWMSYEEASLSDVAYAFDFGGADNYDHNYQYDGGCVIGNVCFPKAAAVYQASGNQEIKAVGTAFAGTDAEYTVKIYTELTDSGDPESGEFMATQSGVSTYEGFYTIELDDPVFVQKGTYFSVVLEGTGGTSLNLMYDATYQGGNGIDFVAACHENETFVYSSWRGWNDAISYYSGSEMTMRIKAYTDDAEGITEVKTLTEDMVSEICDQEYTGEAVEPVVEVKDGNTILKKGTDYKVTYAENIAIGEAVVTVQGMRGYKGSVTKKFRIVPKTLTEDMLSAPDKEYDGKNYDKAVVVDIDGELDSDDYFLSYYVDRLPRGETLEGAPVDAGDYIVEMTGKGNYQGCVEKSFTIEAYTLTEEMVSIPDDDYCGDSHAGTTVTALGRKLGSEDYRVVYYRDNGETGEVLSSAPVDAGSYFAVVEGIGNYKGSVRKSFRINALDITSGMISAREMDYNGEGYDLLTVLSDEGPLDDENYSVSYYVDQTPRAEALGSAPVDAGDYIVVVVGKGNYKGEAEAAFSIRKASVDEAQILPLYSDNNEFLGISVSLAGKELDDEDYEINFFDGSGETKLPGIPEETGCYVVKISGTGNYEGEASAKFSIYAGKLSAVMFEVSDGIYSGTEHRAVKAKEGLVKEGGYTVQYNKTPVSAGSYTATVKGTGEYEGTILYSFRIEKLTLTETMVEDIADQIYTGRAIKPGVTLKTGDNVIDSGNYSVSYRNNTKAGTATVKITGKGNCQGTVEKTFEILPKSVEDLKVSVAACVYSGRELAPKVTVSDGKKKLSAGKDYTVVFENTLNADTSLEDDANPCVTIIGKGDYAGEKKVSFNILPYTATAKQIGLSLYRNQEGSVSLDVTVNKLAVTEGTDYTVVITDQETGAETERAELKVGAKYAVTLNFMGNYTSKTPLVIRNVACCTDVTDFAVKFVVNGEKRDEISPFMYNGKAKKPTVAVVAGDEVLSSKCYTVSYRNNINAGTATVTVTGKGSYAGSVSREFVIQPKELDPNVAISPIKDMTYTGKEMKPSVAIKGLKIGVGKDYQIVGYANNTNVNHEGDELPTVIVTLSENYRMDGEKTFTRTFNIKPAKINSVKAAKAYYQAGEEVKPALTVKAGKLVLEETDYSVAWSDHVDVGKANAVITADGSTGNFYTEKPLRVNFNITRESLSGAKAVQTGNPVYTGEKIDFHDFFTLYDQEGNVIAEDQYEVTPDDRVNAGSVSVTFRAKSGSGTRFTGKKTVKCKVAAAYIGDFLSLTETGLPDKVYNKGKALTFTSKELKAAFQDKVSGKAISTSSFKVTYADNREKGRGKLYITGKGNYSGMTVIYFSIVP